MVKKLRLVEADINCSDSEFKAVNANVLECNDKIHHLADRTGCTPYAVEYRLKCSDGVYRWFRAKGETQRNMNGDPLRVAGILALIEGQKQREAELDITITRFELSREMLNDGIWDLS